MAGLGGPLTAQTQLSPVLAASTASLSAASETPASLPDAPSASLSSSADMPLSAVADDQAPQGAGPKPLAGKFDTIILPGQQAVALHGREKAIYGLHDSFSWTTITGFTISAGFSQLIDSQPHFGHNPEAFGKREGAAALRSTIQTMTTDAVFSPMFHDDPRYYVLGDGHGFFGRVLYAASRVVITRSSHSTDERLNAPLLLGYGVAAASNNAYYPDQDRGFQNTMENWGTSLAGAALGFEVDEFLDDALHAIHIRRN